MDRINGQSVDSAHQAHKNSQTNANGEQTLRSPRRWAFL